MNHSGTYRPGAQWLPWIHGFSDPDDLIGDDLPTATRYLSIFGWELSMSRPAEPFPAPETEEAPRSSGAPLV